MDIVIDTGVAIATQSVIREIAENAVIVTTAAFNSASNWCDLVTQGTWIPVKTILDTALFCDALECKMGRVQMEATKSCVWDRSMIVAKDDFPNNRFWRAIPCDDGLHYVVGMFSWR